MESNTPIAIVGMSCRFAGDVDSPEKLWKLVSEGRSAWSEIPKNRFNIDGFLHPNFEKLNGTNVAGGHFLEEDVSLFDANFFNLSAETAAALDPQFRLQLESTYEALESAGITLQDVAGSNTSVFAGSFFRDYHESLIRDPDALPRFLLMGTGAAMASNRLSHFFDLRGPSMSVDTGCSTTLTALHQGCQSLRTGESDMSIVGGANIMFNPDMFLAMSSMTLISKDGRSYAFDSRANGYGRGEGSATIILKRLDDALRDGDPIRAIIRETGVNQDGKTETITTPSGEAQEALIRACYKKAGLDPSQTTYFEAHGTGTPTGDPIEVKAISSVFQDTRPSGDPLRIGSVKTNIGHTETASGVAAIIKVALALEKGQIPPSVNYEKPNEKLRLDDWKLKVPTELEPWDGKEDVRRASINNFGYGGSNAHVIMEDLDSFTGSRRLQQAANLDNASSRSRRSSSALEYLSRRRVFVLSGKDERATQAIVSNLKDYLLNTKTTDEDGFLDNLAYTLGHRRSRFPWVTSVSADTVEALIKILDSPKAKPAKAAIASPRVGFVYNGQGAQWWAMGRELIEVYPVFKAALLDCNKHLEKLGATWNMIEELKRDADTSKVNQLDYSTPVCVAVQIALTNLLRAWGVTPTAVTSHSSGEIAAAYAAGALDLQSAMAIAFARGGLASESNRQIARQGGMMAVGLGVEDSRRFLSRTTTGKVVVACENSPNSITLSGDVCGLEQLERAFQQENIFARRLKVDAAWHSHHMEAVAEAYHSAMDKKVRSPQDHFDFIFSSPSTGTRMEDAHEIGSPAHWVRSLTGRVQFVDAFRNMCFDTPGAELSVDMVIEVGPHAALSGPIQEILRMHEFNGVVIPYESCLVRKKHAVETMHTLVSSLLQKGYPVNLAPVNFPYGREGIKVLHDLPRYPWNHQTRHWIEPRFNKALRHRQEPPHDFLGSLVLGTDLSAPSWRHIVRMSDIPWVRDHVVQSNVIYPAAGYISMAIEGMAQHAARQGRKGRVLGYQLRDIDILNALVVPETADGIELQLSLRPCGEKVLDIKGWTEFNVQSVSSDNIWIDHCKGLISVEHSSGDEMGFCQNALPGHGFKLAHPMNESAYRTRVSPQDMYAGLRSGGICHGPIFQNIKSIRTRGQQSVTSFTVADSKATMPKHHQHDHVVHPTTLDSVFQAAYTAIPDSSNVRQTPKVPKTISKLWVSHDINAQAGHFFKAYTNLSHIDNQSMTTGLTVFESPANEMIESIAPVITIDGFVCQSIGTAPVQQTDSWEQDKFTTTQWVPDIGLLKEAYLKDNLSSHISDQERDTLMDLRQACLFFIHDALAELTAADIKRLERHQRKFYIWMGHQAELARTNQLAPDSSRWIKVPLKEKLALFEKVRSGSTNGEMVCKLGPHIVPILRSEITALEVMLEKELLSRYYLDALKWGRTNAKLGELVKLYAQKNPRAKMIEIGAGTGGATSHILQGLGNSKEGTGPNVGSYDFTDVSSGFFEAAKEKFQDWNNVVKYKKLDIEQDPMKQGFEEGGYDVVIACQVLHATKSMNNTMANVRRLLKPGGKLFLMETTKDPVDLQFVFGFLPGWWLSEEEERKFSPSLTIPMWDRVLNRTGFSGIDAEIRDCDDDDLYAFSVMMSTAATGPPKFDFDIAFVTANPTTPNPWLDQLGVSIGLLTWTVPTVHSLDSVTADDNRVCIFVDDSENPILASADHTEFEGLKTLSTRSKGVLWLTQGGAMDFKTPHAGLAAGFLRSLRQEYVGKRLGTLDLDPTRPLCSAESVSSITQVFRSFFNYSNLEAASDFEFAERNGVISVPRYIKDVCRNNNVFRRPAEQSVYPLEPFIQQDRPLRLTIGTTGLLDTLAFDDDASALEELPEDFVEIEPRAFGVNFRDVMVAIGQLKSRVMGYDCSGVVTRVGSVAAANDYKPGDRVSVLLRGHYGSRTRIHWTSAVHIPEDMGFETAASLPTQFVAAYVSLYDNARLQRGETVLIHSATGGVGQAAVMLAQRVGAEVFVTVGSEEKRKFVMEHFGIHSDHIFSSRDVSFASGVKEMTGGKGVDVVLNSLAGTLLQASFNCLAPFGRFVEIGKKDFELNNSLGMEAFTRAVSFSSVDAIALGECKPMEANRIMKDIVRMVAEKEINTVYPISVLPLSDVEKAFRLMQAGKHMGKIVLAVDDETMVPVVPRKLNARLRTDASYLVVGGFGGIGRSVCHWLAEHGAQHIAVMSRSANSFGKADQLQTELISAVGHQVKVVGLGCDISNMKELNRALAKYAGTGAPPIKGVIHGGMQLKDSVLDNMTLEDHNAALHPKLHGSWNLHQYFSGEGDLDFYIMLSSLVGVVGFASQSNYSAGGTFQDALAQHRVARGLPAVSIDLGIVKSVGHLAEEQESAKTIEALQRHGFMGLREIEILAAIDSAIATPLAGALMLGINTGPAGQTEDSPLRRDARFSQLRYQKTEQEGGQMSNKSGSGDLASKLASASTFDDAAEAVVGGITKKLVDIFMIPEDDIIPSKSLADFGVDSLVAVELRNMLSMKAGADLSIFDIMQSPSITALAGAVAARSSHVDTAILRG
ncbi:Type I Iterative PKS [Podospora pseudoanserina]|uniref:Type I Iterative PKS n=1 Tax=Podospora pseudoanserina TaxID=2609844 RepID=A0ABR0ICE9_9PEZI|nr:Type I Iterative PKS [Podospora pseudoanserina]